MMRPRIRSAGQSAFTLLSVLFLMLTSAACAEGEGQGAQATKKAKKAAPLDEDDFKRLTSPLKANEQAPDVFRVAFETTKGPILLEVHRAWAPNGADRFYNLVQLGYYEDIAFFRVIKDFMVQFGMHGNPRINAAWANARIRDDPVRQSNTRGMVTFAKRSQPNTRTTQLFINLVDNKNLDATGFAPFAKVIEGMGVVDQIFVVGEGGPGGPGPSQKRIQILGNPYLRDKFPKLDYLNSARIVE